MDLVFDGPHFLAVDKPAGWLTVPGRTGKGDPRPVLGLVLQEKLKLRLWPVHRLDAEVSGLVLYAKDPEAHRAANQWFESHTVKKTYEAFTDLPEGVWRTGDTRKWQSKLLRGKKRAYDHPRGKLAITRAEYVGRQGQLGHWRLFPETGRPHQLRVHLADNAAPIAGDALYGSPIAWPSGIALRAVRLDVSACDGHKSLGLPDIIAVRGLSAPSDAAPVGAP